MTVCIREKAKEIKMERRRFLGDKLVLATHNQGKVKEIGELLSPFNVEVISAGDLGLPEPEETGKTFAANSELKALAAAKEANLPALADDSGLEVHSLNNEPGIYSARWAEVEKDGREYRDFDVAMSRINDALADAEDREANFVCALTIAWPDGHVETVEGKVFGDMCWPPRGDLGFGYDPMFVPTGYDKTFAEMPREDKRAISHRTNAFKKLINEVF
jgi:XTP/dITP diphosphohydrolase